MISIEKGENNLQKELIGLAQMRPATEAQVATFPRDCYETDNIEPGSHILMNHDNKTHVNCVTNRAIVL